MRGGYLEKAEGLMRKYNPGYNQLQYFMTKVRLLTKRQELRGNYAPFFLLLLVSDNLIEVSCVYE
jgi:hypothetical protein